MSCLGHVMILCHSIDASYVVEITIDPVGVPMLSPRDFSSVETL